MSRYTTRSGSQISVILSSLDNGAIGEACSYGGENFQASRRGFKLLVGINEQKSVKTHHRERM